MLLPQGSKMLASAQLRIQKNMMTSENLMKVSQFLVQEEEGVKIVLVGPKSSYGANGKENQKIGIGRLEKYDVKTDSRYEYGELTERHCAAMYNLKNKGSPVKMLICVTMYNEDAADLCRTLSGIYQNLKYFYNDDDVAVIVVADGFDKVHPTVIDYMNRIGVLKVDSTKYNDLLKEMKDPKLSGGRKLPSRAAFLFGKKVPHIGINSENNDRRLDGKLNLFFCIKLKNSGKLSSHKWFFLGFCNYLNPSHCMLLDAGTRPSDRAIFRFNEAFELDPQVGGVCGNMGVILEKKEFPVISCCISCIQKEEEEVEKTIPPNKDEFRKEADNKCKKKQLIENSRTSVYENRPKLTVKENPAGAREKEPFIVEIQDDPDPKWEAIKEAEKKKWEKMGCCAKASSGCVWFFDKVFGNMLYFLLKFLIFLEEIHRKFLSSIINVQFSQMYEYEISHILDKSMESFFGFIQVLPGAFSAYRWEAIKSDKLMRKYFATVLEDEKRELSCMEANVYLAEDRVMCFNIFAMRGKNFILKYVEDARAWTDVMVTLIRLISQRRRWLNGSWFAGLHVLDNTLDIEMSSHSFFRKCAFYVLTMYNIMTTILTYISIALFYVSLNISVQALEDPLGEDPNSILSYTQGIILFFDALLVLQLFIALTYKVNEPEVEVWYKAIFLLMGLYTFGSYVIIIYYILQNFFFNQGVDYTSFMGLLNTMSPVMWSTLITGLSYAIPILLNLGSVPRLSVGALSGIIYMPINMIVIPIYSYCNLDDVSWGTREDAGDKKADKESKTQTYKDFKARQVVVWVLTNLVCAYAFLYWLQRDEGSRSIVVSVFIYVFCGVLAFKAVFACMNKVKETFINCCRCGCLALYRAEEKRKDWQKNYANGQAPPAGGPRERGARSPAPAAPGPAPASQRVPPPQIAH